MTDYRDWLSRFTGIYLFAFRGEIEKVNMALAFLQETGPSDEELTKIWDAQVAHNIHRRKLIREKKPIKRDTSNLYKYFKERHWDRMISSSAEEERQSGFSICCECGLSRPTNERGWQTREEKTFCTPCYAKTFCHEKDGPTNYNVLRQAYGRRIPQNPGESGHQYIARIWGTGKKRSVGTDKPEMSSDGGIPDPSEKGLPEDEWNHG